MSDRQKIFTALAASALLHVTGFLLIVFWGRLHAEIMKPLENLRLVEVAIAPTPTPEPEPVNFTQLEPMATPIPIDSDGLQKTEKEPERALFQSDRSSKAASELPATGDLPLPSQLGKNRYELAFETKQFAPPEMEFAPAPALPEAVRPASTPAPKSPPEPQPTAPPESTPAPTPKAEPLYRSTPAPTIAPQATPDDLAKPTPAPTEKPYESIAMLAPTPVPNTPKQSGASVETQQNKIEGGISNRGKTGVDAIGTPVGRYRKKIADAIGSRWNSYVKQRMDLITTGSVRIKFFITKKGGVEDLKVISNDANAALENFSVGAITSGKLPEIPPELAPTLDKGRFEVEYTFTIYPD
jgi:outer membrane biosynthesis protein TonB